MTIDGNNLSGGGGIKIYSLHSSEISITGNSIASSPDPCIYAEYFYESVVNISENDLNGGWGFWVDYSESSGVTVDGNSIESSIVLLAS